MLKIKTKHSLTKYFLLSQRISLQSVKRTDVVVESLSIKKLWSENALFFYF